MDFKLNHGPWNKLFSGQIEEHEVEIYSNQKGMLLSMIYDEENGEKKGALIELFKVFFAKGELEHFAESLSKNAISFVKHSQAGNIKILMIDSGADYVKFEEELFAQEVDQKIEQLSAFSETVKESAKANELELNELEKASEEEKGFFSTMPLLQLILAPKLKKEIKSAIEGKPVTHGELILGKTKTGEMLKEPLAVFEKSVVIGGNHNERMKVIHVFSESALLSGFSTIIIDQEDNFELLKQQTSKPEKLKEFGVDIDPIGFPIKTFKPLEDIKVNLQVVNPKALLELFGLKKGIVLETIVKTMNENKTESIEELIKLVEQMPETKELNSFQKQRTMRVLQLIEETHPRLFSGTNNVEEIEKKGIKGIGRAGILKIGKNPRENLLLINSIFKELLEKHKKEKKTSQLNSFIVFPKTDSLMRRESELSMVRETAETLKELSEYGVGFIAEAEHFTDLDENLRKEFESKLTIIKDDDVGIELENKKNYRITIRPSLSDCNSNLEN